MSSLENQARIFRFFSLAFAYPNQAFLPELKKALGAIAGLKIELEALPPAFEKETMERLQAEYTRLFINGYPTTPCAPYESVYREKRMLGKASMEVQAMYQEWGMSAQTSLTDHLATEFEFMAFLCSAATLEDMAADAKTALQVFLSEHIEKWIPKFSNDLQENAKVEAYKLLGQILEKMISDISVESLSSEL